MAKTYDLSDLSVLVVEDNLFMASIIKTFLREFGIHSISEACDGTQALERAYYFKPDLIVADYRMPGFDGIDFTRLIRTAPESPNPEVPIIMVTSHTDRKRIIKARDAGVTEVLTKPISATDLYRRIVEVIERPRVFAKSDSFTGPSRRRRQAGDRSGPERRGAAASPE